MANDDEYKFFQPVWARPSGPGHLERDRGLVRDPSADLPAPKPPKGPILMPVPPTVPVVPRPPKRPALPKAKQGPFNVFEPIEGDPYRYPEPPAPPGLAWRDRLDAWVLHEARKHVDRRGKPYMPDRQPLPPGRQLPAPEDKKRLPRPESSLYWMADKAEIDAYASAQLSSATTSNVDALVSTSSKTLRDKSKALAQFDAWLDACGIRYFQAHELIRHKWRRSRGRNQDMVAQWFLFDHFDAEIMPDGIFPVLPRLVIPPPWLWPNILPALRVLDRFRHYLGKPVTIYSAYRHPHYNFDHVENASKNSFHMDFAAIDFTYSDRMKGSHLDSSVFVDWFERTYRQTGDGVGRYHEPMNFLHLDVGLNRHLIKGKAQNWWKPDNHPRVMP